VSTTPNQGWGFPRGRGALFVTGVLLGLAGLAGCAPSASAVEARLDHTRGSPQELAGQFLEALRGNDVERLADLALDEHEFRTIVWPELPASRPERHVPMDYVWGDLHQKSRNSLRRILAAYAERPLELIDVEFEGETTEYDTFRVHRDSRLVVRDELGTVRRLGLFGSVIERAGGYKIFSYVVD